MPTNCVQRLRKRARAKSCGVGQLSGRNPSAVAADPAFELLLALERLGVRTPVRDHPLDERAHLGEGGVRFVRSEVAHGCNPMRR